MSDDAAVGNSHTSPADDAIPNSGTSDDTVDRSTQSDDLDPTGRKLSDEAARWRRELRATETKLTAAETRETILAARVAELQRADINRAVATKLASADDFWIAPGVNLDDFIVNGEVDLDAVHAKADEIVAARPHWKAKWPVGAPASAVTGDGKAPKAAEQPTWAGLLKGRSAG
jgi:hypothetical protein